MKEFSTSISSDSHWTALRDKNGVEWASPHEAHKFIDENFAPLVISLSIILAVELIVVGILAR